VWSTVAVPEVLARFVPSEWPGASLDERCGAWKDARHSFDAAHPGIMAVDFVDLLRYEIAERRRVYGWSR